NNSVLVRGNGSGWNNLSYVGYSGSSNRLSILDGGVVTYYLDACIGYGIGSVGNSVLISGAGSSWTNPWASVYYVGYQGRGNSLTLSNGASLFASNLWIGAGPTAHSNAVIVTDVGTWLGIPDLYVGHTSSWSRLSILNGGTVVNSGSGYLGYDAVSSNNSVLVSGPGSLWANQMLVIGYNGSSNRLEILAGGRVVSPTTYIGYMSGSVSNSVFINGGYLFATNVAGSGALDVVRGTFTLNSGTVMVDRLLATNGAGIITFNSGTFVTRESVVSNGLYFVVGDGSGAASMFLQAGVHFYANDVHVNTNATVVSQDAIITNAVAGSRLINFGTLQGRGLVYQPVGNQGTITATGGTLRLAGGFTNGASGPVNAGLLAALGGDAHLQVGQSFTNIGTIWLNHPTAAMTVTDASSNLVNAAAGWIHGQGAISAFLDNAGTVSNETGGLLTFSLAANNQAGGSLVASGGSAIVFNGAVTNSGTVTARNGSSLQFNQGLTLADTGNLALNVSTAIVTGTLLLGSGGVITMPHTNDVLVMRDNFVNGSVDTNSFNMRWGVMTFGGTASTVTNTFEVASTNKGAVFSGFDRNMALGTLNITNHISFVNQINNGGGLGTNEALYVDVLHLFNGATLELSQLTIYVGMQFIYEDGSGTKVLTGRPGDAITESNKDSLGLVNVFLDDGGQIVFIPEPGASALLLAGMVALSSRKRTRTHRR
ncbi:MAG: PEP-CTERM sorting domain-containing protein, partial [Verrucomicrobia bacterium]|nr:PEP-CTERM sorting domain-containing protein [Verrucomicrobiota bacterium]